MHLEIRKWLVFKLEFFRQNLSSLEDLHLKWKLYQKPIFLEHLMGEFLTVFVQVLVSKSHNLLREEIAMSIFNMASVDLPAFFDKFLPHLLSGTEQLDENQRSILLQGIKQKKKEKNRRKINLLVNFSVSTLIFLTVLL